MSQLVQVRHCCADAERVPCRKVGSRDLRAGAIDRYEGDVASDDVMVWREVRKQVSMSTGDKDESVHAVFDERGEVIELGRRSRCLRTDEADAARARNLFLEVVGEGREDRIRELRHDDADRWRARCALGGGAIVSQLVNRGQDPAAGIFGDLSNAVENA